MAGLVDNPNNTAKTPAEYRQEALQRLLDRVQGVTNTLGADATVNPQQDWQTLAAQYKAKTSNVLNKASQQAYINQAMKNMLGT